MKDMVLAVKVDMVDWYNLRVSCWEVQVARDCGCTRIARLDAAVCYEMLDVVIDYNMIRRYLRATHDFVIHLTSSTR